MMPRKSPLFVCALLVACAPAAPPDPIGEPAAQVLAGELSISGAWALYPLMVRWADDFTTLHPGVQIHVAAGGSGRGAVDALDGFVDLGMLSREPTEQERSLGAWSLPVAQDAVVVVASDASPQIESLRAHGLSLPDLQRAFGTPGQQRRWDLVLEGGQPYPLRTYSRSDACGTKNVFAAALVLDPDALEAMGVYGDPGLVDSVRRDPHGLGYSNASMAYDPASGRPVAGIVVVPLDLDDDDRIGADEASAAERTRLEAAIGDGRYPASLVRTLSLVAPAPPVDPLARAFLRWAAGEGQQHVEPLGYLPLPAAQLEAARASVAP